MGLLDSVKSLFGKWSGKRKRDDEVDSGGTKRKRVDSYTLTPASKFHKSEINEIRTCKNYYVYNEEIRSSETRTVEFKQGGVLFNNDQCVQLIRKYGPAFLNCEGGVLLAGVTDSGIVKGVSVSKSNEYTINMLAKKEIERFRPPVSHDLWSISYVPITGSASRFSQSEKVVVEITFKKGYGNEIYENSVHEVYLRRDGGVQGPLRPLDIRNLVISKYNETLKSRKLDNQKKSLKCIKSAKPTETKSVKSVEKEKLKKEEEEKRLRLQKKGIIYIDLD